MDESKSIAAPEQGAEHPANGVVTGFDLGEGARLLRLAAESWRDRDVLAIIFLRALASLTESAPSQGLQGFTGREMVEAMSTILGRAWAAGDADGGSGKLRTQWRELQERWKTKAEGVRQRFGDLGWSQAIRPERLEGGGSGHLTRYRLVSDPLDPAATLDDSFAQQATAPLGTQVPALQYTCEDLDDAGAFARFFSRGLGLAGVTGAAFRTLLLASIVTTGVLVYLLLITVLFSAGTVLPSLIAAGLIASGYVTTFRPLVELPLTRVALAPWWLQTPEDDRLIEWRGPPRYEGRTIKASRYTAPCPVCGERVVARSGGWKHGFALVGRCREAPDAHVFSFDHVTRQGSRLG